jgi:predicted alpha/beta hydrolase family esterase
VPATSKPHQISVAGLPPILVVSTTNDPATPYQAGVDLAKELGGSLLTFQGTQHTVVFQGNTCVDDIAAKYLIDVVPPPAGARC